MKQNFALCTLSTLQGVIWVSEQDIQVFKNNVASNNFNIFDLIKLTVFPSKFTQLVGSFF